MGVGAFLCKNLHTGLRMVGWSGEGEIVQQQGPRLDECRDCHEGMRLLALSDSHTVE